MAFFRKPQRYARHRISLHKDRDGFLSIHYTVNGRPVQLWMLTSPDVSAARKSVDSLESQLRTLGERNVSVSLPPALAA